ncbi:MauE/DoxX family redox-associated membrane protein [Brevibacillus fluminis]|uniref:MauE/DoxX family redox-associated membrane protein n=1 Tax=Brevibacillus fluminis TaxID=511487 RepID=UPI003F8AB4E4
MYEFVALVLRFSLGTILLSAGLGKIFKIDRHIVVVKAYKIVPDTWILWFVWAEVIAEFVAGILLFTGYLREIPYILAASLFVMYSIAISMNLVRGQKDLDCGCGGVVGNHKLSWTLVMRNGIFVFICVLLFWGAGETGNRFPLFSNNWIQSLFMCWVVLLFVRVVTEVLKLYQRVNALFDGKEKN